MLVLLQQSQQHLVQIGYITQVEIQLTSSSYGQKLLAFVVQLHTHAINTYPQIRQVITLLTIKSSRIHLSLTQITQFRCSPAMLQK